MEKSDSKSLHIVMFPWLAMGHLIPFLHFSKILAQKGHKISYISTPRNLTRLPKIPPKLSHIIKLVSLPFPKVESLPDHAESSMDIPHQKAQFLKIAFDLLESPLVTFLETTTPRPDWIVFDYASHWVPSIASKLGVSTAYFSLFTAATQAFLGPPSLLLDGKVTRSTAEDFCRVPEWIPFESDIVYRLHEVMKYTEGAVGNESGVSDTVRFLASVDGCDLVLFRTSFEFEPEWFGLICELYPKPVIPIGLLPPSLENDDFDDYDNWDFIKKSLDEQEVDSVVFVALGSEATLSQVELGELALGLEHSGFPFFWVIRKPITRSAHTLPNGFLERVKGRGIVYIGWVPQVRILSHSSIGGFLTHCGWNSAIEGLTFGRVLIFFPVMNDQGLNVRLLSGKKLGVEIPRSDSDGSFTSESVAKSIKVAMVSEEGESLRANAREMKGVLGDKTAVGPRRKTSGGDHGRCHCLSTYLSCRLAKGGDPLDISPALPLLVIVESPEEETDEYFVGSPKKTIGYVSCPSLVACHSPSPCSSLLFYQLFFFNKIIVVVLGIIRFIRLLNKVKNSKRYVAKSHSTSFIQMTQINLFVVS